MNYIVGLDVMSHVTDAKWFRDSTQIVLPKKRLDGHRNALTDTFHVTVVDEDETVRIIASPTVLLEVRDWLNERGILQP